MSRRRKEPGPLRASQDVRRTEHHRERQATRMAVSGCEDLDDLLVPILAHPNPHTVPERGPRRFRHWKAPFWKRRTNERRRRNQALLDVVDI